jgi:hypothetical protein
VECAARLGLQALQFKNAAQLEEGLRGAGLEF